MIQRALRKDWLYIRYSRQTPQSVRLLDNGSTALVIHTKVHASCVSAIRLTWGEH